MAVPGDQWSHMLDWCVSRDDCPDWSTLLISHSPATRQYIDGDRQEIEIDTQTSHNPLIV